MATKNVASTAPTGTSPLVTVLDDKYVKGMTADARVQSVPLVDALSRAWPSDAHFTGYEPRSAPVASEPGKRAFGRLVMHEGKDEDTGVILPAVYDVLEYLEPEQNVRMVALIGDVDDPVAHDTNTPARDEWRADVLPRIEAAGLAHYQTKGGYRALATVDFVIRTPEDYKTWKRLYLGWCAYLEATHGLVLDRSCHDWTRCYRLPNVVRDGKVQRAALVGEICEMHESEWIDPGEIAPAEAKKAKGPLKPAEPVPSDVPEPTDRVLELATEAFQKRWLAGGRVGTNAWLHLCGWALGRGWVKGELGALLKIVDEREPDAGKRREHWHILGNARAIDGPGGARAWLGDDFDRVDAIMARNLDSFREAIDRAVARLDAAEAAPPPPPATVGPFNFVAGGTTAKTTPPPADPPPAQPPADPLDILGTDPGFADARKPMDWLIPHFQIGPGKYTLFTAFGNGGKTPTAALLALCVSSGTPFLGHEVKRVVPVIYFAYEGGRNARRKMLRIGKDLGIDPEELRAKGMLRVIDAHALDPSRIKAIRAAIKKYGYGLAILDTVTSALRGANVGRNDEAWARPLLDLAEISEETRCSFVGLTHDTKSTSGADIRGTAGTEAIIGAAQTAIRLEPDASDKNLITVTCVRVSDGSQFEPLQIQWVDGDGSLGARIGAVENGVEVPLRCVLKGEGAAGRRGSNLGDLNSKREAKAYEAKARAVPRVLNAIRATQKGGVCDYKRFEHEAGEISKGGLREVVSRLVEAEVISQSMFGGYDFTPKASGFTKEALEEKALEAVMGESVRLRRTVL